METIQLHKKGSKANLLFMDYVKVPSGELRSIKKTQLVSRYRTYEKQEICLKINGYACTSNMVNDLGFCLEEYIDFIKGYSQDNSYVYDVDKQCVKMFYLPMIEDTLSLSLPFNQGYQISEDNVDGIIVAIWRSLYGC